MKYPFNENGPKLYTTQEENNPPEYFNFSNHNQNDVGSNALSAKSVPDFTEKLIGSLTNNRKTEEKPVIEETGGKKSFRLRKDPYDEGQFFYKKTGFTVDEGITVLVGCNGSGKSTLMMLMKEYLRRKDEKTLILEYNDVHDGRSTGIEKQFYNNNINLAATMMCSSEGEQIWMNVGSFIGSIGRAVHKSNRKNVWVFLDGIDSGLSIDNIIEMKEFFHELPTLEPDKHFYFIISANAFELACGEKCLDVANMKYVTFSNYEKYKRFVLASREQKKLRDKTEE